MKFLKVLALVVGFLVVAVAIFYLYASFKVDQRLSTWYDVTPESIPLPSDSASIAEGSHLVDIKGCRDCHGDNLGGKVFNDDFLLGTMAGPNLTRGKGGVPANYSTSNWVKAIRHGLDSAGFPLMVMPSLETSTMSQEDIQSMIAYQNSLPPVDNTLPKSKLGLLIKSMVFLGKIDLIPAEQIDHNAAVVPSVDMASPAKFGKYLSAMCSGCHHADMKGGDPMAPGFPPVPDLTSTGATGRWTKEQFHTVLRTGKTPEGRMLDPNMPVQMTKHYTDNELDALYTFLRSL